WFFLNMILVAAALAVFIVFQPDVSLYAIFDQQGTDRLRTAGLLIAHDLSQTPKAKWPDVLTRHAAIHRVDFTIVLEDGSRFSSTNGELPEPVMAQARDALRRRPPKGPFPPPHELGDPQRLPQHLPGGGSPNDRAIGRKPPMPPEGYDGKPHFMMRTQRPSRYWSGLRIPLPPGPMQPPETAILLAVSDSLTGNGFFFDPLPWMVVAAAVILISVLLWIPMVRNITRPLARMTRATEDIANGRFDVSIHEPRTDEIGRLAKAINHMTSRLSAFVKGQKRFLGDVAHELGSPIARIQFGLGALEQRIGKENRQRVIDVMEDVDHLSKLVNELLAFSRAEMKSKTVELEKIELFPVVQTAVKRENSPAAKIVVRIKPGIRVIASSELLTRALANLLRNAVKYAAGDGPIVVNAQKRNGGVEIQVQDAGSGVPDDLLDQLFEPFFRPEASRDRDSGGVGLGLAIVKTCVETCKGTVSAANLKPKGFAVTIHLNA
ncbi:HAMP domain-containing sensor histidine kinase, partial [Desulfosarcina sp.]|uniref:sensor histidine kinase n=1 Tax=Desulfosarcina sp. TaxID=2027861 RepID=UPI0029A39040